MKMSFKVEKSYKITYSDLHSIIAIFKGNTPPVFEVDGALINVNEVLKGSVKCEEV